MNVSLLQLFDWKVLLSVALITSFVTEAINQITPKTVPSKLILPMIAFVITLLRLPLEFKALSDWQNFMLNVISTIAFAILFYEYLGKYSVQAIFNLLKRKVDTESNDNNQPPQPPQQG